MRHADAERVGMRSGQTSCDRFGTASFGEGMRAAFLMILATTGCGGGAERSVSEAHVRDALDEIESRVRAQGDFCVKSPAQQSFEIKRAIVLDIVSGAVGTEGGERMGVAGLREAVRLAEPDSALGRTIQEFEPTTAIRAAIDRAARSPAATGVQRVKVSNETASGPVAPTPSPVAQGSSEKASPVVPAKTQEKTGLTLGDVIAAARWAVDMPETCVEGVKDIARDTGWTVGACSLAPLMGPVPCAAMAIDLTRQTFLTGVQCMVEGAKNAPGIPEQLPPEKGPVRTEWLLQLPKSCVDGVSDVGRGALWTVTKCTLAGTGVAGDVSSCVDEAVGWTITIGKGSVVCLKEAIASTPQSEVKSVVKPVEAAPVVPRPHSEPREIQQFRDLIRDMGTPGGLDRHRDRALERAIEFKEARDRVHGREVLDA